jgi:hypothetical protein
MEVFMKIITRIMTMLLLTLSLTVVMLISGCGNDESKNSGCPSDSFLANDTDIIIGPADAAVEIASVNGSPFPGGPYGFAPLQFTITDSRGFPRNNVCLILYTDGSWYTDNTYLTPVIGSGPANAVVAVTNDYGNAVLYWVTEFLPPAVPAAGTTAGADLEGQSFIQANTGTLMWTFNVDWTVKGEPAP